MADPGWALRTGDDPHEVARQASEAHERFLATGTPGTRVRPLVVESWQRCLRSGLDPERSVAPVELVDSALEQWRCAHPLAGVLPVIRRLLVEDATGAGLLVAISDATGRLLWVEGDSKLRTRAERMHFMAGADWSEAQAGTNAPGTALALDRPVQIFAAEHLVRHVTAWSCSAAPIHDPDTGAILGAVDLTGKEEVAGPHALFLIRATAAAAESELRVQRLLVQAATGRPQPPPNTRIQGLGRDFALLQRADATMRLSLRHSELLLLLNAHPDGLSGDQLGTALNEHDLAPVTLRAELSRLRAVLGQDRLVSRPYRLTERLNTDGEDVAAQLAAGRVGAAVHLYRGPLLPCSQAPGIARMRYDLHESLRRALLAGRDADALLRFADTDHGRLDWQVWHAAWKALSPSSARRDQVEAHLAYLDRELGLPPAHRLGGTVRPHRGILATSLQPARF